MHFRLGNSGFLHKMAEHLEHLNSCACFHLLNYVKCTLFWGLQQKLVRKSKRSFVFQDFRQFFYVKVNQTSLHQTKWRKQANKKTYFSTVLVLSADNEQPGTLWVSEKVVKTISKCFLSRWNTVWIRKIAWNLLPFSIKKTDVVWSALKGRTKRDVADWQAHMPAFTG